MNIASRLSLFVLVLGAFGASPALAKTGVISAFSDPTSCVSKGKTEAAILKQLPKGADPARVSVEITGRKVHWERAIEVKTRVGKRTEKRSLSVLKRECENTPALIALVVARDAEPLLAAEAEAPDQLATRRTADPADAAPQPTRRKRLSRDKLEDDLSDSAEPRVADLDDVGFVERYSPLMFEDELVPELEDGWVWFVVGGLVSEFGGNIWVPALANAITGNDVKAPKGYYPAALKIVAAHYIPHVLLLLSIPCSLALLPVLIGFPLYFLAIGFNAFVNFPAFVVNSVWLTPVALVNEYNRRAKADPKRRARQVPARPATTAMAY